MNDLKHSNLTHNLLLETPANALNSTKTGLAFSQYDENSKHLVLKKYNKIISG